MIDRYYPCIKYKDGFSLIELLVCVFIFSVSLLGISKMHALSLKEGMDHAQRSHAVMTVQELTARMRSNTAGTYAGAYQQAAQGLDCSVGVVPAKMCSDHYLTSSASAKNCTPSEQARYDVWEVACGTKVEGVLSGSASQILFHSVAISCATGASCPAGASHNIELKWLSKGAEAVDDFAQEQSISQAVLL